LGRRARVYEGVDNAMPAHGPTTVPGATDPDEQGTVAQGLTVEFEGGSREEYDQVDAHLGIDPEAKIPGWPPGPVCHAAGATSSGWVVFGVRESVDSHQLFMDGRPASALQAVGFPGPPSRVEWIDLAAYWARAGT
jgi:hypothetical protein